jgi:hypothetical protein
VAAVAAAAAAAVAAAVAAVAVVVTKVTTTVIIIRDNLHKLPHEGCGVKADMVHEDRKISVLKSFDSSKSGEQWG